MHDCCSDACEAVSAQRLGEYVGQLPRRVDPLDADLSRLRRLANPVMTNVDVLRRAMQHAFTADKRHGRLVVAVQL